MIFQIEGSAVGIVIMTSSQCKVGLYISYVGARFLKKKVNSISTSGGYDRIQSKMVTTFCNKQTYREKLGT